MTTPTTNRRELRPEEVPEVQRFLEVREKYAKFRETHPKFFDQLDHLIEEYNAALEDAEKTCRANQVSCGPFQLLGRPTVKWNPEQVLEELGFEAFKKLGGEEKTVTTFVIDTSRCETAFQQDQIPEEVADKVRTVTCRYGKVSRMSLP